MLAKSSLGQPMCIYGDPAYPLRVHLQAPFRHRVLTPQMQAYNCAMSAVRCSIEWIFGDIINYFKFFDFKNNLKIGLSQVGECIDMFVWKSQFFALDPPSLEEYFA